MRFDPKVITTLHKMDAFTHTLLDSLKMGPVAQELGLFAQELGLFAQASARMLTTTELALFVQELVIFAQAS